MLRKKIKNLEKSRLNDYWGEIWGAFKMFYTFLKPLCYKDFVILIFSYFNTF